MVANGLVHPIVLFSSDIPTLWMYMLASILKVKDRRIYRVRSGIRTGNSALAFDFVTKRRKIIFDCTYNRTSLTPINANEVINLIFDGYLVLYRLGPTVVIE
jgi:hypothetical protein